MNSRRTAARSVCCTRSTRLGASRECVKKCATLTTPKHRTFHQNIPMSKESVTSEASVLCFFCVYSFPVWALWLLSAETSSAGESISRLKPVFQIIEWNEIKCLSNLQIWWSNYSSWYNLSEHVNLVHQENLENIKRSIKRPKHMMRHDCCWHHLYKRNRQFQTFFKDRKCSQGPKGCFQNLEFHLRSR